MDTIEKLTCLEFRPRISESDYVMFFVQTDTEKCSSPVGRKGGKQIVHLGTKCDDQQAIIHEICHSLGMWHEQSRPDRDGYVQIFEENIEPKELSQFMKRTAYDVDSLGTKYDYGSVMHYDLHVFAKNTSLYSMRVTNHEEYKRRGFPLIGTVQTLSKLDTVQLNRLYNCPGSGEPGHLMVSIEKAQNLKSVSPQSNVFVWIKAYDDTRANKALITLPIVNNPNPQFNEVLDFGSCVSWQYMDVSVMDFDL